MNRPASELLHGYRCECHTSRPANGDATRLLGSIDVETAPQAIRWIRVALRTLSPALNSEAFEEAWQWLSEDHHDALQALIQGEPVNLTLQQVPTTIQWTARPAQFLKLTTRQGINLPACTREYTELHTSVSNNFLYVFKAPRSAPRALPGSPPLLSPPRSGPRLRRSRGKSERQWRGETLYGWARSAPRL
ncbi:hypothetical protein ACFV85_09960 [Streptomyces niveus]|uniref:hypothetical protein n=1 Tax=Streptomyces niveus TaxID=193462 RepID=UPI00365320F3